MIAMQEVERCEASTPLLLGQRVQEKSHSYMYRTLRHVAFILYVIFLFWQLIGLALYLIRAFHCCLKERKTSFRCHNFTVFPHSGELELAWLLSLDITIALFAIVLSRVPGFLGFDIIMGRVIRLPSFWTLTLLIATEIAGFVVIVAVAELTAMQIALIAAFSFHGVSLVVILSLLNFTPINPLKNFDSSAVYILSKLTVLLLFLQLFCVFLVGLVQFAFKITGLDEVEKSADFVTVFRKIREFPQVVFHYRVAVFFWQKLFLDGRNILGHYSRLRLGRQGI